MSTAFAAVIGHSHVTAIWQAWSAIPRQSTLKFIQFGREPGLMPEDRVNGSEFREASACFFAVEGNVHIFLGFRKHPQPYDFELAPESTIEYPHLAGSFEPDAEIIPYSQMKFTMLAYMAEPFTKPLEM